MAFRIGARLDTDADVVASAPERAPTLDAVCGAFAELDHDARRLALNL